VGAGAPPPSGGTDLPLRGPAARPSARTAPPALGGAGATPEGTDARAGTPPTVAGIGSPAPGMGGRVPAGSDPRGRAGGAGGTDPRGWAAPPGETDPPALAGGGPPAGWVGAREAEGGLTCSAVCSAGTQPRYP